jgi:deoxynucleoside triphosphate triphosphohydrolase SAMHD1
MSADSFSSGVCSQRNEDEEDEEAPQRASLEKLKLSQLRQLASSRGGEQESIVETDDIEDAGARREALIGIILEAPPGASAKGKLFNDCVHDHYELPHLCVKLMDTPEFQRLRDLKQLGGTYGVFTCAAHNRFEHSLGTAHLAGRVASQLRKLQPVLGITEKDVLCCQLAGLCHDLGHGPMSHMFDGKFLTKMKDIKGDDWVPPHEELSTQLLEHLIEQNQLWGEFERMGLDETDLMFIMEMIDHKARGELPVGGDKGDGEEPEGDEPWRLYGGRPVEKQFLYEIISNDVNGVDVDKFDYFMRDAMQLNIPITFDPKRLMANTRVARSARDGKLHIAFQVKEAWNLYELFHTRYTLHKRAYQHKTANSIEEMLCEVMVLAEDHLRIYRGSAIDPRTGQPKIYTPYESLQDMGAYTKVVDSVFHDIEISLKEEMQPAQVS